MTNVTLAKSVNGVMSPNPKRIGLANTSNPMTIMWIFLMIADQKKRSKVC